VHRVNRNEAACDEQVAAVNALFIVHTRAMEAGEWDYNSFTTLCRLQSAQ
jgi:hypothetical protein